MQWVNKVVFAAVALTLLSGGTRQDLPPRQIELVVYETPFCAPCRDFRYDTVKPYFQSDRGATMPMLVVDYDYLGTAGRALNSPIDHLPTTIILDRGREVGRIVGNPTHGAFIKKVDELVGATG